MDKDFFYFKEFKIKHNNTAMKVGTDGVLLGAYVDCTGAKNILDIGTGTGLIAIMMAQKSNAEIDAIEIIDEVRLLARENINMCKWKNRITAITIDLQNYYPDKTYDLIVSNPPFYTTDIIAPDKNRAAARHNLSLTIEDLAIHSSRLLSKNGRLYVIYPVKEAEIFSKEVSKHGLLKISELFVKPNFTKNPVRIIMGFSKTASEIISKTISIEKYKRHDYSDEFREITGDFYYKKPE